MSEFEFEQNKNPIFSGNPEPESVPQAELPLTEESAAAETPVAEAAGTADEAPVFHETPVSEESPVSDYPPVAEAYRRETTERQEAPRSADRNEQTWTRQQTVRPEQTWQAPPARPAEEKKVKAKKSGGFARRAVALALVCALLGGLAGVGGAWLLTSRRDSRSGSTSTIQVAAPRETSAIQTVQVENGQLMTADQVYEKNVNSTVGITTETTTNFWGYQSTTAAAGSGFILSDDGYILTNQHVIADANTITVAMYDGTTYPATLVGYDASNDIAVLKIDAKGLTPVTLGNSDALKVGQDVIAIGNPLGELTFSLTRGAVSALNRAVTLSSKVTMNLIQTDTAINAGNSGGPLFNMYGEVIGITNAKYSSSGYSGEASIDNIGFAIPINSVREIVTSIIEKGYISRPYIGVSVANVSEESQSYGMPKGAAIRSVEEDGPAAKAGLQANDIITSVNGTEISSYEEFAQLVSESEIGTELELGVYRKGETLQLKVTVGEKIQQAIPETNENDNRGQQGGQDSDQGQDNPWGGSDPFGGMFPWGWGFGG